LKISGGTAALVRLVPAGNVNFFEQKNPHQYRHHAGIFAGSVESAFAEDEIGAYQAILLSFLPQGMFHLGVNPDGGQPLLLLLLKSCFFIYRRYISSYLTISKIIFIHIVKFLPLSHPCFSFCAGRTK